MTASDHLSVQSNKFTDIRLNEWIKKMAIIEEELQEEKIQL